ncbi:MAG: VCBS repeat-containing protein [Bacteroidota bacterium]|nr:VCBS repeat-containing protein [Bacteroidota bacterium]
MKTLISVLIILFISAGILYANEPAAVKTTFSKKDIKGLADQYVKNNAGVKNPVLIDIDNDGNFDILNFTSKGNVEYFRNTGTLEVPLFTLVNKNFDKYEVNTFLPGGLMMPVFFADNDGDKDVDVFGIIADGYDSKTHKQKYKTVFIENTLDIDNYTLITIILVLLIVALLVVILK